MNYSLLLLSGGIGSRIGVGKPKQYVKLHGIPMIVYSLVAIKDLKQIKELIVNYPPNEKENMEHLVKSSGITIPVVYVPAGETRQESVSNMLEAVSYENVIIHESARPIVTDETFSTLIDSEFKNCGYMHEIPFTVAPVDPDSRLVTGSLERGRLRNVLLPQKFETNALKKAHKASTDKNLIFTEDACLFVDNGYEFHFIDGSDTNIKVTYKSDLILAETLLNHDSSEEFMI